ncbi:MAG: hypothetical protein A3K65_09625 [Euryarchaeota archaeon RBG_16_68_12]|nr:MAG: hypothetical protein A3K65_09625 [Euryarchaeota archaeon RBG_16_68_12]
MAGARGVRTRAGWTIRHRLRPGDAGALARLHGLLYAEERGWDATFEAYVAAGLADFARSSRPERDRLWLAESGGRIIGSIAIVGRSRTAAQLRWFLVVPGHRGRGLGTDLMGRALRFCRARGVRTVFLWTTSDLAEAARLYARFGFRKTEEKTHRIWGKSVTEERFGLRL